MEVEKITRKGQWEVKNSFMKVRSLLRVFYFIERTSQLGTFLFLFPDNSWKCI